VTTSAIKFSFFQSGHVTKFHYCLARYIFLSQDVPTAESTDADDQPGRSTGEPQHRLKVFKGFGSEGAAEPSLAKQKMDHQFPNAKSPDAVHRDKNRIHFQARAGTW